MPELYIFDQDDNLLTIITEDTGLVSAPVRIELNSVPDTPFSFTVESDSENAEHVKEENKVVYRDHEGDLRLVVIKELDDSDSIDGPETTAICEPEFMELNEHVVVDRRFTDRTAQFMLDAALENTRYEGDVQVDLGTASTNFYYLTSVEAIWKIIALMGGEFKDVVEFDNSNNIINRKILLQRRRGADLGQRFEIDHNIAEIGRTVLSYPLTAMYGRGASLETDGGGNTRHIDFAYVEWKVSAGDPVDKPLGQKWVGDPNALQEYGRLLDGDLLHRYGIFSNQNYETPEELLQATWEDLQEKNKPIVNYRLSVDLFDDKVDLGDSAIAIDRYFARPIEVQTRIIAMEYDLLDIEGTMTVEMGQFLSSQLDDNRIDRIIEDISRIDYSATLAIESADGKNTNYYGPDEPVGDELREGDIWFKVVDGDYTETYRFDGIQWQLIVSKDVKDIEEVANTARNNANEAVEKANLATSNANEAIAEAQTAFDEAQAALTTASSASDLASTVYDLATALDTTVSGHTTTITDIENELSSKMTTVDANAKFATQSALQQTSQSLSSDIVAVQGNLDSLEIGGRNLLVGSDYFEGWEILSAGLDSVSNKQEVREYNSITFRTPSNGVSIISRLVQVDHGKKYTAQAYVEKLDGQSDSYILGVLAYDENNNLIDEEVLELLDGTESATTLSYVSSYKGLLVYGSNTPNHLWTTFSIKDSRVAYVRARAGNYRTGSEFVQRVKVSNMQLETGNKVTGWGRAPEDNEYQFSSFKQTVLDVTVRVGNSEGDITALQTTATGFASRIENAEGDINTLTSTAQGLQNRITNAEGDISTVTQLANATQTRMTNAEGNINTLTQTASSLDSTIKSVRDDLDGLEIGGRNYFVISEAIENRLISWAYGTLGNETGSLVSGFIPVDKNEQFILNHPAQQLFYYTSNKVHLDYGGNKIPGDSFTIPNLDSVKFIRIVFRNNFLNGRSKEEVRIKLEKGNILTDWSPAPEDMATQSQFTQLSNNINLRVMKNDIINQINISDESILISGKKLILDGNTTVTGTFRVANANITSVDAGKMTTGTLDAANVNIINLNASNIVSGTINTANIMIRGGSATDYTMIDGSYLESRGKFTRTWRGTTRTHDIKLRLQDGYLRTRNDSLDRSLYYSDYGISTFVDGSGAEAGENSSGTIEFFSHEYDSAVRGLTLHSSGILGLRANKNIIMLDAYASVNIESEESAIYFRPITSRSGSNVFRMTLSEGSNPDGYLLYGSEADPQASGLRFSKRRSDPRLQVVDFNYQTGGNTTIEAGIGEFNDIKRRSGNSNIYIAHANLLTVGDDSTGGRLASIATYNRTYSSAANMHITSAGTFGRSTSARKYKRDIEPITKEYAYNFLDNVTPIFYRPHNTADENMSLSHYGYIADDVAPIEPRLVQFGQDGEPEGFSYDRTPTLLHVVLKNEVKRIDELEELAETQQLIIEGLQLKIAKLESVA